MFLKKIFKKEKIEKKEDVSATDLVDTTKAEKIKRVYKSVQTTTKKQRRSKMHKAVPTRSRVDINDVVLKPHLTEKAAKLSEDNIYAFIVNRKSTAEDVCVALESLYKKRPNKVSFAKKGPKAVSARRQSGKNPGFRKPTKKAYAYFPKGSKLDII